MRCKVLNGSLKGKLKVFEHLVTFFKKYGAAWSMSTCSLPYQQTIGFLLQNHYQAVTTLIIPLITQKTYCTMAEPTKSTFAGLTPKS